MAKDTKAAAAEAEDSNAKQEIHEKLAALVHEKTGKRIGRAGGKLLFDTAVQMVFASATKEGSFRFPGGYGSLHVRNLNEGTKPKRLPSGATTTIGAGRRKLRYVEGNEVKGLMGTKRPKTAPAAGDSASQPANA
jgi:hypothetical protein